MVYGATQHWHSWLDAAAPARDGVPGHWFRANRMFRPPDLLVRYLRQTATLPSPLSMTVRREALFEVGGFEESFRTLYEDQVFLARLCLRHAVYVSNEWLDRYRQHPDGPAPWATRAARRPWRAKYLASVESHLEAQGFRDSEVWSALQFARALDERPATGWRARLSRLARRAANSAADRLLGS